jgi:hypothetical protein
MAPSFVAAALLAGYGRFAAQEGFLGGMAD